MVIGSFAVTTMLTKNTFLEEIRKQYVLTARAKGLGERQVLWKHVFRNALIPLVTGFPAAFIGAFFTGSLLIETLFSLDGLGLLSYESDHPARLPGGAGHAVPVHADRPGDQADLRPLLRVGRSAREVRLSLPDDRHAVAVARAAAPGCASGATASASGAWCSSRRWWC